MYRQFNRFPFFSPDDTTGKGAAGAVSSDDKEDVIEFLGEDDEPEVLELPKTKVKTEGTKEEGEEEEGKEEETETEEEDELKELEEELEEPDEEKLELVTPVRRAEILRKYPQLFKDFPYLEKAYYREQQFTELFPTIPDAKEALEAKDTLDRFENDVLSGNTETILNAVRQDSPRSFAKIVDDYLPTLARVDEKAYLHVLGNVTKHTIMEMVNEGRRSNNDALQSAAQILNQFVFGSSDFKPPTKLSTDEKPEDKGKEAEISRREQAFQKQQFDTARGDLNTRVNNAISATIAANIDPRNSMTDYVKKNATREAIETLQTLISKDARFRALADKLWEKAFEDGFSRSSVDRIKSAYTSKAKTLLPSVIKKARNEALRGMGKRVKEDSEQEESPSKKGPLPAGKPSSQRAGGKITKAQDIPKGMRTIDFLMQD